MKVNVVVSALCAVYMIVPNIIILAPQKQSCSVHVVVSCMSPLPLCLSNLPRPPTQPTAVNIYNNIYIYIYIKNTYYIFLLYPYRIFQSYPLVDLLCNFLENPGTPGDAGPRPQYITYATLHARGSRIQASLGYPVLLQTGNPSDSGPKSI